jgi:predicted DNA-binding transcriptional regulator YafY
MQTLVIDTNGIVKKLEQRGFSRTQAEGITEALKELDTSSLATKAALDSAVQKLQLAMRDQAITIITWMTGILVAQGALIVALIQYFK